MVAIKDMKMPTCCASCPFDALSRCLLTRQFIKGGCLVNGEDKRLDDCPLVEIEERKVGKWILHEKSVSTGFKDLRECSCCHCYFRWEMPRNSYCPNCGAEMRGAENG